MQDNLARVYDNEKPNFKVHINPHFENITLIRKKIDALLDLRLTLSIEKLSSVIINKSRLLQLINAQKEKMDDDRVKKELDSVFNEYFPVKQELPVIPTAKSIWDNNSSVLKSSVEAKIDSELMSLKEMENNILNHDNGENGISMVKRDAHHKSSSTGDLPNVA